jgi:hypothetical protein
MPTLVDLLRYLASPENMDIWVLLDIKVSLAKTKTLADIEEAS